LVIPKRFSLQSHNTYTRCLGSSFVIIMPNESLGASISIELLCTHKQPGGNLSNQVNDEIEYPE